MNAFWSARHDTKCCQSLLRRKNHTGTEVLTLPHPEKCQCTPSGLPRGVHKIIKQLLRMNPSAARFACKDRPYAGNSFLKHTVHDLMGVLLHGISETCNLSLTSSRTAWLKAHHKLLLHECMRKAKRLVEQPLRSQGDCGLAVGLSKVCSQAGFHAKAAPGPVPLPPWRLTLRKTPHNFGQLTPCYGFLP